MPLGNFPYTFVQKTKAKASEVNANFQHIKDWINVTKIATADLQDGLITQDKLNAALAALLGVSSGASVRRGKSIIAAEGTRSNVAYGALSNGPDQVSAIDLPNGGLIRVAFHALAKVTDANGFAAVFLDSNQVVINDADGAPSAASAEVNGMASFYCPIVSTPNGLRFNGMPGGSDNTVVTTGQLLASTAGGGGTPHYGGEMLIFAGPDSYDVSVQFKTPGGGTLTAKERKLWVEAVGF